MNILIVFAELIAQFIRRNPFFILVMLILAIAVPNLFHGIMVFVAAGVGALILIVLISALLLRNRIRKMAREMEQNGGQGSANFGGFNGFGGSSNFGGFTGNGQAQSNQQKDDVHIRQDGQSNEKKVSGNVGEYVDFEEIEEK